jgi:tetratricopeptide (TPR) repeat protein/TolB-like protein
VHDSGVAVEAPPRPAWQQWRRALPAVAALVVLIAAALIWSRPGSAPDSTRIAVLPVVPASSEPDAPQMVEALTDRLAATLGEIDSLQVTDPASVRRVADGRSPVQLAAALSVDAVVQSTVKLLGGENGGPRRAQVDVKLMAAGSGRTLWAETFVRDIGDLRSLHAAIARGVAGTVRAGVSPSVARRLDRVEVTTQGAAEAYFQGLYHLKQLSADHTRLAVKAFERAIELDPLYAPAHAALAQSYVDLGVLGAMTHAEARALAAVRIERALSLDGESSEARAVNADLKFFYNWDWRAADEEYQRAIMANGSSARALSQYARYLAGAGRLDEALEYATRSFELNPLSSSAASTVALVHLFRRDAPAALRAVDEALKRDPDSSGVHIIRSRILAASNALDEAIVAAERAIAQAGPLAPPGWRAHLISLRARRQSADEGAEAIRRLSEELRSRNQRMGPVHYAYMYLGLGSSEEALAYLERAADERSPDVLWLAVDPRVDELRGEPRFERVLERIGSR